MHRPCWQKGHFKAQGLHRCQCAHCMPRTMTLMAADDDRPLPIGSVQQWLWIRRPPTLPPYIRHTSWAAPAAYEKKPPCWASVCTCVCACTYACVHACMHACAPAHASAHIYEVSIRKPQHCVI